MKTIIAKRLNNYRFSPAQVLVGGFAFTILIGTILLWLPISSQEGRLALIDSLFTATSAVCVTGLTVVDTGNYFTVFGQSVIMLLIWVGSLGFMTMATLIFIFLGRQITLRERLVLREALNAESIQGLVLLAKTIIKLSLAIELTGALLLSIRFVPQFGAVKGIFFSLFHAISAYGNAGFDLFGNFQSLTNYQGDFLVSGVILFLFIIGGLGFTVILEIYQKQRFSSFSLHTKMVLIITLLLLCIGTLVIFSIEYNNDSTMAPLSIWEKLLTAFFTAATPRTAGFNVIRTDMLRPASLIFICALMFIGASPASTGGGIKTTTFGAVLIGVVSLIKGKEEPTVFEKRLPSLIILKAMAIFVIALVLIFGVTCILNLTENQDFLNIFFEVLSAFGTVGLSTGITPELSPWGKAMIIFTMFCGRLGPLTLVLAFARRREKNNIRYPQERIMIG